MYTIRKIIAFFIMTIFCILPAMHGSDSENGDFLVTDIYTKPDTPKAGDKVTILCNYKYLGIPVAGEWKVSLFIDNKLVKKDTLNSSVQAMGSKTISYKWKTDKKGTSEVKCLLEPDKNFTEDKKNNNEKIVSVKVEQATIDFFMKSVKTDKEKYEGWDKVKLTCVYSSTGVTKSNMPNLRIKGYLGPYESEIKSAEDPDGSVDFELKTSKTLDGKVEAGCILDPGHKTQDSNRNNNEKKKTLNIYREKQHKKKMLNKPFKIILWEDINYSGKKVVFKVKPQDYKYIYDVSSEGFDNDSASSIEVPKGCFVVLYKDKNIEGTKEKFLKNDRWLGDNKIGNDSVSSLFIKCGLPPKK